MNIILFKESECSDDGVVELSDVRAEHIRTVLRAEPGATVRVGLIDGPKGTGTVDVLDQNKAVLRCVLDQNIPERPVVDLLLALPRPKVMKRLWAQLAAVGVGRITLTNAWKVERNYFDTHVLNPEIYESYLIEGLQQAGDTLIPEVSIHRQFKVLIEDELDALSPDTQRVVAHPGGDRSVAEVVDLGRRTLLAVGPEGGWTDYEMDLLQQHGFVSVGMGSRILRTDTACVALLSLVHDALVSRIPGDS